MQWFWRDGGVGHGRCDSDLELVRDTALLYCCGRSSVHIYVGMNFAVAPQTIFLWEWILQSLLTPYFCGNEFCSHCSVHTYTGINLAVALQVILTVTWERILQSLFSSYLRTLEWILQSHYEFWSHSSDHTFVEINLSSETNHPLQLTDQNDEEE